MPSANTKSEKNAASEATDPLRQAIIMVEHKIRNLEKRKAKLDSYKESGKPLSRDLQEAVSKYDEVIHQLDVSREFVKQFNAISLDTEKAKKKAAKKEALERTAAEVSKIKQVLLIQDVLQNMGTYQAREDFLAGRNGAPTLTDDDLKYLDDLYAEVSPKHEGPISFNVQVQRAAECLLAIVDGKSKELAGTTCLKLQTIVNSIHECGYFDKPAPGTVEEEVEPTLVEVQPMEPSEEVMEEPETPAVVTSVSPVAAPPVVPPENTNTLPQTPVLPLTIPKPTPMHLLQNIVPVSQVESNMYNAQGFKPPNSNQPTAPSIAQNQRPPINDVMSRVSGNFTFFQDSELDIADISGATQGPQQPQPSGPPAAIPSRTFTNQSFNGQPGPTPMAFQPAPPTNPYYVGGFPPQAAPHYSQDLIQGFAGGPPGPNVPVAPAVPNNSIPIPNQLSTGDSPNRGFPPPPQHIPSSYTPQSNQPPVPAPQAFPTTNMPIPSSAAPEEPPRPTVNDVIENETQHQDWAAPPDNNEWAGEEWEWNTQGTDSAKNSGAPKPRGDRGDRPRSNYHNNRNGNRNNYTNNRPPRNREWDSGNNGNGGGSHYNNMNGYQPRGGGDGHPKDNRDKDGNQRRGPPQNRGPRPDRSDRPSQGQARNNSGPRQPRTGNRGPGGPPNTYRQE